MLGHLKHLQPQLRTVFSAKFKMLHSISNSVPSDAAALLGCVVSDRSDRLHVPLRSASFSSHRAEQSDIQQVHKVWCGGSRRPLMTLDHEAVDITVVLVRDVSCPVMWPRVDKSSSRGKIAVREFPAFPWEVSQTFIICCSTENKH